MLVRTTLRLEESLKKAAELKALEESLTLQEIFNTALNDYLKSQAKKQARRIVFKSHNLGTPLDLLRRKDYYSNP